MSEVSRGNSQPSLSQAQGVGEVALLAVPLFEGDVVKPGGDFPTGGAHPDPQEALAPLPETIA